MKAPLEALSADLEKKFGAWKLFRRYRDVRFSTVKRSKGYGAMSAADAKLGASHSLVSDTWTWPVHGLRHPPEGDTSGWYWWSGEWSEAADFFLPLHAAHLVQRCPQVAEYLEAPPGTRVLLARGYADVWTDEALLDI